jgi:hypothetical protein
MVRGLSGKHGVKFILDFGFPSCSPPVPNDVPQAIPNCATLHPVLPFAYNSTICKLYNKIEGKGYTIFYFGSVHSVRDTPNNQLIIWINYILEARTIKFDKPHHLGIFIFFCFSLFVRCSYGVPIKFPHCSHMPQDDPYGSLWLYPIWFAQCSKNIGDRPIKWLLL